MTQDAIVTKLLPNKMAEVAVTRATACGSNCGNCESCIFQNELKAEAHNHIGALPGQKVVIQSKSSRVFGAAVLVYVMPLLLFFIGYAIAYAAGAGESVCVAVSFAALAVSGVILVLSQKYKKSEKPITFDIIRFADASEGT